jgi:hypothetical protein
MLDLAKKEEAAFEFTRFPTKAEKWRRYLGILFNTHVILDFPCM